MTDTVLDAPTGSKVGAYNPIEAGIALMLDKHGSVLTTPPAVTGDSKALVTVKASRQELVKFRTTLEAARKTAKADSLAYGRLVDSEAARIQAIATPLELAYDKIVEVEEKRLADIKAAELEVERKRIAGHQARIQAIKDVRETANLCRTAERIQQLIDGMPALLEGNLEEFQVDAETAFNEVCTVLGQLLQVKKEAEAAAAQLAIQQEALRVQQVEIDRKAKIQTNLTDLRMLLVRAGSAPDAPAIAYFLELAREVVIDDSYAEFLLEAEHTQDSVCEQIEALLNTKLEQEAEAASVADQTRLNAKHQEQLDQQKREQDEREAQQQALAAKPLVARVAEAITGPRPSFAAPRNVGEVVAAVMGTDHPVAQAMKTPAPRRFTGRSEIDRPDDEDIVIGLASHFDATEAEVVAWLRDIDLDGVLANLQQVTA